MAGSLAIVAAALCVSLLEIAYRLLKRAAMKKTQKLTELNAEVNGLIQEDDHWEMLRSEIGAMNEVELCAWINRMNAV
jgi:thioesterase domain-containing protein